MELEELYKEIQPRIYAFFYVKTMSKESAEDLTQEVFLSGNEKCSFLFWKCNYSNMAFRNREKFTKKILSLEQVQREAGCSSARRKESVAVTRRRISQKKKKWGDY